MIAKRFVRFSDLAYDRRCELGSQRTVLEALAMYDQAPRPYTELDTRRVEGLEDSLRAHCGHAAELKRSHHRVRPVVRGRSRRCYRPTADES
jgi:hypothetical protein